MRFDRIRRCEKMDVKGLQEGEKPLSMHMGISSIPGTKKSQQDAVFGKVDENRTVAVVCDGMGDAHGGKLASEAVVRSFTDDVLSQDKISDIPVFLKEEAIKLDQEVCDLKKTDEKLANVGTTISAVIIEENDLYWLSAGDSRIYIIRGEEIVAVTVDHTYRLKMDEELKKGQITIEEYMALERQAETLVSYLGVGNLSLMDINQVPFKLEEDDIIILCSHGLYKCLPEEDIRELVYYEEPDMPRAARRLTDIVMRRAEEIQDNTSVVILQYSRV